MCRGLQPYARHPMKEMRVGARLDPVEHRGHIRRTALVAVIRRSSFNIAPKGSWRNIALCLAKGKKKFRPNFKFSLNIFLIFSTLWVSEK